MTAVTAVHILGTSFTSILLTLTPPLVKHAYCCIFLFVSRLDTVAVAAIVTSQLLGFAGSDNRSIVASEVCCLWFAAACSSAEAVSCAINFLLLCTSTKAPTPAPNAPLMAPPFTTHGAGSSSSASCQEALSHTKCCGQGILQRLP